MYKDLFHSTVFTKKTIPGISFIYKEFRGFLALKVLKMRYYKEYQKKRISATVSGCGVGKAFENSEKLLRRVKFLLYISLYNH